MKVLRVALAGAQGMAHVNGMRSPSDSSKTNLLLTLTKALDARGLQAAIFISQPSVARTRHEDRDLTLLMGLSTARQDMHLADQQIRAALAHHSTEYQVLYGTAEECLAQALSLIEALMDKPVANIARRMLDDVNIKQPWLWACDKCSDPQCEHKLLTDLLSRRSRTIAP